MFKNRLIKYLFLFIISLFSAHENLNADTLDEILKLTFSTNKQLILTRTNLESSKRSIEISKSALGIDLTASFNGARDWDFSNSQNNDSYSNSIIGRYNLFDGNFSKNKVLLAQTSYDISKLKLLELEQTILLDTINTYLNVLRDEKLVELSSNNVAVLERQYLEIIDRFELGEVTRTDVSQAESALAAARANLTAKNGALTISKEIFISLVGISPQKLISKIPNFQLPLTVDMAKKNSLKNHPKILIAEKEEKIAKINIEIAKSQKSPSINLRSILSHSYNNITGNNNSVSLRLEGSIPIFNSGKINNEIDQAKINYRAQKESSLLVKRLIEQEIALAWSNVLVSESSIEARKRQVEASKLAYEGVVVEEKLGTRTTLDVINAEQSLLNARTQLASAEREHIYAKFALLAATGELNLKKLNIKTQNKF